MAMPAELTDKQTFGDLDMHFTIFPQGDENISEMKQLVINCVSQAIEATDRTSNGVGASKDGHGLVSLRSIEGYQVDLEFIPFHLFELANLVKSNGDMWWIINLGLREHGLVLNEDGLCIRGALAKPVALRQNLFLSANPVAILNYLGLPAHELWQEIEGGTNQPVGVTQERVFELVTSLRFFRSEQVVHWNGLDSRKGRQRSAKRPMIGQLYQWLVDKGVIQKPISEKREQSSASAPSHEPSTCGEISLKKAILDAAAAFDKVDLLQTAFSNARAESEETEYKNLCKKHLNGNVVKERLGDIEGPGIGQVLLELRGESWKSTWCNWLEDASSEEIFRRIEAAGAKFSFKPVAAMANKAS